MRHVRRENKCIASSRHFHVVDVSEHPTCTAPKQEVRVVQAEHARVVALGGVRLGREVEPQHTGNVGVWLGVKRQVLAVAEDGTLTSTNPSLIVHSGIKCRPSEVNALGAQVDPLVTDL